VEQTDELFASTGVVFGKKKRIKEMMGDVAPSPSRNSDFGEHDPTLFENGHAGVWLKTLGSQGSEKTCCPSPYHSNVVHREAL
jgi:hypothetical protein